MRQELIRFQKLFSKCGINNCRNGSWTEKLAEEETIEEKPLIAASMFGVTTPCVEQAKAVLEQAGYEVLVFHATGTGGKTMESLIESGFFTGVLDLTTTEWCDEVDKYSC